MNILGEILENHRPVERPAIGCLDKWLAENGVPLESVLRSRILANPMMQHANMEDIIAQMRWDLERVETMDEAKEPGFREKYIQRMMEKTVPSLCAACEIKEHDYERLKTLILNGDSFTDERDGITYKTVKIGNQVWMAENLAFHSEGSRYYNNNPKNVNRYGRLYVWRDAMRVVPEGWHVPTDDEWNELVAYVDGGKISRGSHVSETAGNKLKARSGWRAIENESVENRNRNGTDDYGFSAKPGGRGFADGSFGSLLGSGYWWSASEFDKKTASRYDMTGIGYVYHSLMKKDNFLSVRCVKD